MNRQDKLFIGQVGSMDQTIRIMATAPVGPSRPYISSHSSSHKRKLPLVPAFFFIRHLLS